MVPVPLTSGPILSSGGLGLDCSPGCFTEICPASLGQFSYMVPQPSDILLSGCSTCCRYQAPCLNTYLCLVSKVLCTAYVRL